MGRLSRRAWLSRLKGEERAAAYDTDPGPLGWLIDLMHDAGQVRLEFGMAGGILLGLGWREITAWIDGAQEHDLAPVYRRGIMALSAAYADTAMAARDLECEVPYDPGKEGA